VWDATDEKNMPVSSGIYFYRMTAGEQILQKKMVLLSGKIPEKIKAGRAMCWNDF
jgi:hypothetical protein